MSTETTVTQLTLTLDNYPISTFLSGASLAKLLASLESAGDLTKPGGHSFLKSLGFSSTKDPDIWYSKTSKAYLLMGGGQTYQTIIGVLTDLGYRVEWQVLNSKDFGVPQNRERIYIVGHLGGRCARQIFPITGSSSQNIIQLNKPKMARERIYHRTGISPTLNTGSGGGSGRQSPMVAMDSLTEMARIRRLTPTECERLQGFPDGWTLGSDTQRYKQCGNAVTVNVVAAVMSNLECAL